MESTSVLHPYNSAASRGHFLEMGTPGRPGIQDFSMKSSHSGETTKWGSFEDVLKKIIYIFNNQTIYLKYEFHTLLILYKVIQKIYLHKLYGNVRVYVNFGKNEILTKRVWEFIFRIHNRQLLFSFWNAEGCDMIVYQNTFPYYATVALLQYTYLT